MLQILVLLAVSFFSNIFAQLTIWPSEFSDIRISLNDIYGALYATGWFFILDGIARGNMQYGILGVGLAVFGYICVYMQPFVGKSQYAWIMLELHKLEYHISKRLLAKGDSTVLDGFVEQKITPLEREIEYLKTL
jgi:hypothetical protein